MVAYHLDQIDEDKLLPEEERPSEGETISDATLAIVAGYDTTASTLTGVLYHVIQHSNIYSRLRKELDVYFLTDEGSSLDASKLGELPYLNAVM